MRIRISVGIRIITEGRITTGIICIRKMGITVRITEFTITLSITILKRTMTSGLIDVVKQGRHMDGPITCSSLTQQGDENQREHK
jgi:hypothetical protein